MSVPVLEEELLLVTYPTHPLAKKREVAPADLDRQPFILFETGSITRRLVEEFFTREGDRARDHDGDRERRDHQGDGAHGLGISIIPWQAAAADVRTKQLFCSRIAGHALHRPDRLALSEDEPAAAAVSEVMRVFDDGAAAVRRGGARAAAVLTRLRRAH